MRIRTVTQVGRVGAWILSATYRVDAVWDVWRTQPRTTIGLDMSGDSLVAKARRLVAKMNTRMAGKTLMLASSYTGMHNEGASFLYVGETGDVRSDPYYGPWLPHPEPEEVYV